MGDEHRDLRADSGVNDRHTFTRAMDELQSAMLVMPSEVYYQPKFTYIWTLAVSRFPDALRRRPNPETALREIARCFLDSAGMTVPGELARVTGLPRPDAGRGNRALVAEGYATMPARGEYLARQPPGVTNRAVIKAVVRGTSPSDVTSRTWHVARARRTSHVRARCT